MLTQPPELLAEQMKFLEYDDIISLCNSTPALRTLCAENALLRGVIQSKEPPTIEIRRLDDKEDPEDPIKAHIKIHYRVGSGLKGSILFQLSHDWNSSRFFREVLETLRTGKSRKFWIDGDTHATVNDDRTLVILESSEEPYTKISVNTELMISIIEHMLAMRPFSGIFIYEDGRVEDMKEDISKYEF